MSVTNIGNGRWRVVVKTGFDPETGRPTYFDTTIKGTHEQAKRLEAEHTLFDRGVFSELSLEDYSETCWLPYVKAELAGNTYDFYEGQARKHVYPHIGRKKMHEITVGLTKQFLLGLPESAKIGARKTLSALMTYAADDGIVQLNPVKLLSRTTKRSKTKGKRRRAYRTFSDEERQVFYKAVRGTCIEAACLVMLDGGARREEACGLDWEMFDWENNIAPIEQAYIVRSTKGACEMKEPKNDESWRDLLFEGYAADRLYELSIGQSGPICCEQDGNRMRPDTFNDLFRALCKLYGLPTSITVKHLRHTFATQHLKDGTPISELRDLLGHSSTSSITEMYVIPLQEDLRRAQREMATKHDPRRSASFLA